MFAVENIIRSLEKKERKRIVVFGDYEADYIRQLAKYVDHDFIHITNINPELNMQDFGHVKVYENEMVAPLRSIDLVMCFNRVNTYNKAKQFSNIWHVPIVVIDTSSSFLSAPCPQMANLNINNEDLLFSQEGCFSVGVNEYITDSWSYQDRGLAYTVEPVAEKIERKTKGKVLIDPELPKEYLDSLNFITEEYFTTNLEEATCYLHLWKNVNTLLYKCIASEIPVIVLDDQNDLKDLYVNQACILMRNIEAAKWPEIIKMAENTDFAKAKEYVKDFTAEKFKQRWESILSVTSNIFYKRKA